MGAALPMNIVVITKAALIASTLRGFAFAWLVGENP
jgi:hypothetical protein